MLTCKVCGQGNICEINYLSAAVDVYADWVDKCDEAARQDREEQARSGPARATGQARERASGASRRRDELEDIDAEGEDDDLGVGGGGYAGDGIVADDDDY